MSETAKEKKKRAAEDYSLIASILSLLMVVIAILLNSRINFSDQALMLLMLALFLLSVFAFFAGIIGLKRAVSGRAKIPSYLKGLFGTGMSLVFLFLLTNAIPSNPMFQPRVKQNEAQVNLRAIYTLYRSYHLEMDTFPAAPYINKGGNSYDCFEIVGFNPELHKRYNYNCMDTEFFGPARNNYPCPREIITSTTKDSFTIAACGNLDRDETVDIWTIDDAGNLNNVVDDINN